jgi:methionyl-tRNA formyltransferase
MDRIVIYLNGARGVSVVRALHGAGHGVAAIVIPAALRDADRIAQAAGEAGSALWREADVNAPIFLERLKAAAPHIGIVAGYSTILRNAPIGIPRHGTLNLHAGRLPDYRGGSPLNWQMINGERRAGISVIRLDEGIDTGDVLASAEIDIGDGDTIADLHARANAMFPDLVLSVLRDVEANSLTSRRQDDAKAAYWHQRNDADGRIDWGRMTAGEVDRFVRALTRPYPGAFCFRDGERVRILASRIPELMLRGMPGRICRIMGQGPFVICRDRAVLVTEARNDAGEPVTLRHGEHLH